MDERNNQITQDLIGIVVSYYWLIIPGKRIRTVYIKSEILPKNFIRPKGIKKNILGMWEEITFLALKNLWSQRGAIFKQVDPPE